LGKVVKILFFISVDRGFFSPIEHDHNKHELMTKIQKDISLLQFASSELLNDKEVILEAVKKYGPMLELASKELKNDVEIVLEAIKQNSLSIQFASESIKELC
jgi:hypothetical protein